MSRLLVLVMIPLVLVAGCSSRTPTPAPTGSPSTTGTTSPTEEAGQPPCDPGTGFPVQASGCPDVEPLMGWATAQGGRLTLQPIHTLRNDAEGEAYAREHGLEFPFPNDYHDIAVGSPVGVIVGSETICTGIMQVGYQDPLDDRIVPCEEFLGAASRQRITTAVWQVGAPEQPAFQISELYRP